MARYIYPRIEADFNAGCPGEAALLLAYDRQVTPPDAFGYCLLSNCVINPAPDKAAVFREVARVLKPGAVWRSATSP